MSVFTCSIGRRQTQWSCLPVLLRSVVGLFGNLDTVWRLSATGSRILCRHRQKTTKLHLRTEHLTLLFHNSTVLLHQTTSCTLGLSVRDVDRTMAYWFLFAYYAFMDFFEIGENSATYDKITSNKGVKSAKNNLSNTYLFFNSRPVITNSGWYVVALHRSITVL